LFTISQKAVEEFLTGARGPAALGELEVLAVFNQEKNDKQLVGGRVTVGLVRAKTPFEIIRQAGPEAPRQTLGPGRITWASRKEIRNHSGGKGKEIGLLVSINTACKSATGLLFANSRCVF
jgi:hypothetical protein